MSKRTSNVQAVGLSQVAQAITKLVQPGQPPLLAVVPGAAPVIVDERNAWERQIDKTSKALADVCTPKQIEVIETLAVEAWQRRDEADAWDVLMTARVRELHPTGHVGAAAYFPIVAAIRANFGAYPATCYRDAIKRMQGALPNKADARAKGGSKGYSAVKWHKGIHSSVSKLIGRANKVQAGFVDADVLKQFTAACKALIDAESKLGKRIAADAKSASK